MKIDIVIDAWKAPIFERHLTRSGITYTKAAGITDATVILHIEPVDMRELANVATQAAVECDRKGKS